MLHSKSILYMNHLLYQIYFRDASSAIESFKDCLSLALVDGNCMSGMTVLQEPLAELASDYYSNLCEGYGKSVNNLI